MERVYSVWHTQDRATLQITSFSVSDMTPEEQAKGINRDVAVFPVSGVADESRQQDRAHKYCALLNGHTAYSTTDKGRQRMEDLKIQISQAEIERQDNAELDTGAMTEAARTVAIALGNAMGVSKMAAEPAKKRWWFNRGKA